MIANAVATVQAHSGRLPAKLVEDPVRDEESGVRTVKLRMALSGRKRTARIFGETDWFPYKEGDKVWCELASGGPKAPLQVVGYRGKTPEPAADGNREIHGRGGAVRIVAGDAVITVNNDGEITIYTDSAVKLGKSGGTFDKLMAYTGASTDLGAIKTAFDDLKAEINTELGKIATATDYTGGTVVTNLDTTAHKATDTVEASRET